MNYAAIALWSQVAGSVLFVAALVLVWTKFLQPAVLAAKESKNARIAEAERHRDEAHAIVLSLREEIAHAREDAAAIAARAQRHAESERTSLLAEARSGGERSVTEAGHELDRARAAAREQLREELVASALRIARERAAREIDARTNGRFVDEVLRSIESGVRA